MTAQDLKNSILQLAIQGKLVEQRSEEGTAKELLEQIKAEKESLIKEGKIKKEKPLPGIIEDQIPFEIPDSWKWVRFGNVVNFSMGKTPPRGELEYWGNDYPWVSIADMQADGFINETKERISEKGYIEKFNGKISDKGTLLMSFKLTVGRVSILNIDALHNEAIISIFPFCNYKNIVRNYYFKVLPYLSTFGQSKKAIMGYTLNSTSINNLLIPIPPLEEQKRIVAKIEELLPYVEQYNKAYSKLEVFNKKFPTDMQKSVLQYAIQGKLVEQRPEEGASEDLYQQIQVEKAKLIKEGKIKKEKPLGAITDEEMPFEIPDSWKWVRLRDLALFCGGYAYKSNLYVDNSNNQIIRLGNVKNDKIQLETNPIFISDELAAQTEKYKILPNDILFTMTGTRGKKDYFFTTVVQDEDLEENRLYLNQRVGCLRGIFGIKMEWLSIFLKADIITRQVFMTETGTANQGNIGSESTMNIFIPLPPLAEQERIVAAIEIYLPYCLQLVK